jgi:hypothetical protein
MSSKKANIQSGRSITTNFTHPPVKTKSSKEQGNGKINEHFSQDRFIPKKYMAVHSVA